MNIEYTKEEISKLYRIASSEFAVVNSKIEEIIILKDSYRNHIRELNYKIQHALNNTCIVSFKREVTEYEDKITDLNLALAVYQHLLNDIRSYKDLLLGVTY